MKLTAKDLIIEWHRPFEVTPSEELINGRIAAIEKVKENTTKTFWLDLVRLYFGLPVKSTENRDAFIGSFREQETAFPVINNEILLKMLAGATLCFQLEEEETFNDFISLAILNCNFFNQLNPYDKVEVSKWAIRSLFAELSESFDDEDEDSLETLEENLENEDEEYTANKPDHLLLTKAVRSLISSNRRISEEVNVLWWIFGEKSRITNKYFDEVGFPGIILIAGKELSDLTEVSNTFLSANPLLNKVLLIANKNKNLKKEYSAYATINSVPEGFRSDILEIDLDYVSELTPCLFALNKSREFSSDDDWSGSYKKQSQGADIKKEFSATQLAFQFYNELMFIKNCTHG
jgi:hypothetical protein